jgi:hypothetical protein
VCSGEPLATLVSVFVDGALGRPELLALGLELDKTVDGCCVLCYLPQVAGLTVSLQ